MSKQLVPKRLRYFMQRDGAVFNRMLRIFQRVIAQSLQVHCPGAADVDKAALHICAMAFVHWFGSSLNGYVNLHVFGVDGVFEAVADGDWSSRMRVFVAFGLRCGPALDFSAAMVSNVDLPS